MPSSKLCFHFIIWVSLSTPNTRGTTQLNVWTWVQKKIWSYTCLGGEHSYPCFRSFYSQVLFGSHKSSPSSFSLLAKGLGPGQGFWKKPVETTGASQCGGGSWQSRWRYACWFKSLGLANGHHIVQHAFPGTALIAVNDILKGLTPDLPLTDLAIFALNVRKK